ncbi:MAG: TIGR03619 family F420-dependent LLM class oxidoreductase [Actinobacteria bacterium]|nr:TIGR03619 family F420-dependent LLM class oxidoreductase [Actinomycetota bacterium]
MAKAKFGMYLPQKDFAAAREVALVSERQGFYSVSINDHFVTQIGPPETPQLECFSTLAAIAAVTSQIRVVPAVASASYRTPAMLAKITATIDHLSGGRLVLGLGAGWQRSEYEAHGYSFPPAKVRIEQLAETIQILKAMWTEDSPSFSGQYFSIDGANSYPRPVQQPHIPLMLGGSSERMLRIAAAEADIVNLIPPTSGGKDFLKDRTAIEEFTAETLIEKIALLRRLTEEAGREPGAVEVGGLAMTRVTEDADDPGLRKLSERLGVPDLDRARRSPTVLLGTPDQVTEELRYRIEELGVTYLIIVPTSKETVDLFAEHVMPEFS